MDQQWLFTIAFFAWLAGSVCFVLGLHMMNSPATGRRGNQVSAAGMTIAVVTTLVWLALKDPGLSITAWIIIIAGFLIGGGIGLVMALRVKMTAMPQLVSLFNAVGGGAAALVAIEDYLHVVGTPAESIPTSIFVVLGVIIVSGLTFGVTMVLPIGGADMHVVISLLNSFTGTAAAMSGFVLNNPVLIIAGALVGAAGGILTKLMADAMNRSLMNIMVGGFGGGEGVVAAVEGSGGTVREVSPDDAAIQMAYASKVIVVPGYGLAVAQAQHAVRELAELLEARGVEVVYAIHPVAGRMPGHMNVLLAEANVPYPLLKEMEEINPEFSRADVALVVGANDVTNPAARSNPASPIYGMPILDVDQAKSIVVIKRSMGRGYAGIDNELYTDPKTGMLFADAKAGLEQLAQAVKAL
jgi:NAD(P) transhydrogenase subunit beta